jgi:hypothetical protein
VNQIHRPRFQATFAPWRAKRFAPLGRMWFAPTASIQRRLLYTSWSYLREHARNIHAGVSFGFAIDVGGRREDPSPREHGGRDRRKGHNITRGHSGSYDPAADRGGTVRPNLGVRGSFQWRCLESGWKAPVPTVDWTGGCGHRRGRVLPGISRGDPGASHQLSINCTRPDQTERPRPHGVTTRASVEAAEPVDHRQRPVLPK